MNYRSFVPTLMSTIAAALLLSAAYGAQAAWVVGARPAPPKGAGPGQLVAWRDGSDETRRIAFGKPQTPSGNSFYVAFDPIHELLFVPTVGGNTDIIDAKSLTSSGSMASIAGGRVARVSPDGNVVVIASGKQTAGYSTRSHQRLFVAPVGGNALAFDEGGNNVYVGGNRNKTIQRISIPKGEVTGELAVAHSGDLVQTGNRLYSANMKTGVMSAVDLRTGKVTAIETPEVDPRFDYHNIPGAAKGLMQLAADPRKHRIYAAGFSGHILVFDSDKAQYLGQIQVDAGPHGGPDKLSGLAVIDGGRKALVTVENLKTAVVVDLESKRITRSLPQTASNRWVSLGKR